MYPDTKRIRSHRVTLRFDDYENELITALANYQGEQLSTLLRALALREATVALGLNDVEMLSHKSA